MNQKANDARKLLEIQPGAVAVKVQDLSGARLDWAVAMCEGYALTTDGISHLVENERNILILGPATTSGKPCGYSPSSYWALGGPIIEREQITVEHRGDSGGWRARIWSVEKADFIESGLRGPHCDTALIAAMRCYVMSKLGEVVEIPATLIG